MTLGGIKRRLILTSCKAALHSTWFYSASQQVKKYIFKDQIKASKSVCNVILRSEMEKSDNFEEVDVKKIYFDTIYSGVTWSLISALLSSLRWEEAKNIVAMSLTSGCERRNYFPEFTALHHQTWQIKVDRYSATDWLTADRLVWTIAVSLAVVAM